MEGIGADHTRAGRPSLPEWHEFFGYIKGLVAILLPPFRPFLLA
jgi:hypothetical protein